MTSAAHVVPDLATALADQVPVGTKTKAFHLDRLHRGALSTALRAVTPHDISWSSHA